MPRISKIDQAGIGDKVIAYHLSGLSLQEVCNRMAVEHTLSLTPNNVDDYLKKHSRHIDKKRDKALDNRINWTMDEVRSQLTDTITEIREYIEVHRDDPRAVGVFLKVRLDALDKIAKLLGGYPSEQPTVNVQVNAIFSKEQVEKSLAESEAYFQSLEAVDV
jgi:hypothetical protein